jgi:hypothetical protein
LSVDRVSSIKFLDGDTQQRIAISAFPDKCGCSTLVSFESR